MGAEQTRQEREQFSKFYFEDNEAVLEGIQRKSSHKDMFQSSLSPKYELTSTSHQTSCQWSQCYKAGQKELSLTLTFCQNYLKEQLPNSEYIDELCDAFNLGETAWENVSTQNLAEDQKMNLVRGRDDEELSQIEEEEGDSRYDEEEFLKHLSKSLKDDHACGDRFVNLANLDMVDEEEEMGQMEEAKTPTDRSQIFAQYYFAEEDCKSLAQLLSPIKPKAEFVHQPVKTPPQNPDHGHKAVLDSFIKPASPVQDKSLAEYLMEQPQPVKQESTKFKYFNDNPFDRLFKDITNTEHATQVHVISKCKDSIRGNEEDKDRYNEGSKNCSIKNRSDKPNQGKLVEIDLSKPPKATNLAAKTKPKARTTLLETNSHSQTTPIRESGGANRTSSGRDNKSYSGIHKKSQQVKQDRTPTPKQKKTKKKNYQAVNPFHEISSEEETQKLPVQMSQKQSSIEDTTCTKPSSRKPKVRGYAGFDKVSAEIKTPSISKFEAEEAQIRLEEELIDHSEKHFRQNYFSGRDFWQPKSSAVSREIHHSDSRQEIVNLVNSKPTRESLKKSYKEELQSLNQGSTAAQRFGVDLCKLSEQAMLELADFE